ncbi:MAG: response regulator [Proteobacteria bacterium]|nr:response regulator [Pseudomonadota bacterium]
MNNKTCIVLTDDYYLYYGFRHLASDYDCKMCDFSGKQISHIDFSHPIIIVDLRMLITGKWVGFTELRKRYPRSLFLRLSHRSVSGFISGNAELEADNEYINNIIFRMASIIPCAMYFDDRNEDSATKLTKVEDRLIPLFAGGTIIALQSRAIRCSTKTLYAHRIKISYKLGLRRPSYLTFFLKSMSDKFFAVRQTGLSIFEYDSK